MVAKRKDNPGLARVRHVKRTEYSYDADNRIEEVYTSTDGYVWNREARYFYYPHSLSRNGGRPLARVELGEYNVQEDFA